MSEKNISIKSNARSYFKKAGCSAVGGLITYGLLIMGIGMCAVSIQHSSNSFPESLRNISADTYCLWTLAILPVIFAASGALVASVFHVVHNTCYKNNTKLVSLDSVEPKNTQLHHSKS